MNKCYRIIWSRALGLWVVVSELASKQGRPARRRDRRRHIVPMLASLSLALLAPPLFAAQASGVPALKLATQVAKTTLASTTSLSTVAPTLAATAPLDNLPTGGHVVAGNGTISQSGNTLEVDQTSQKLITDWTRFDIGSGYEVDFVQPDTHAVALNRVTGNDPSRIFGTLHSNGQVFLVNANGVLFAQGASVDVGGLVASTLDIANADFLAGNYHFGGNGGSGVIENHGSLRAADGGYIALLGGTVSNSGIVQAQLGSVALAAGNKVSLDFAGDGLLSVSIDQGVLEALVENHGAVIADGGKVLLSAKAATGLLGGVVNNDGLVQARTLQQHDGQIELLGDMDAGTVNVAGTLDASAPDGGNGGAIETSAAQVHVADGAKITTLAANGHNGDWLIDPQDFTIAASGGDMTGVALGSELASGNVTIESSNGSKSGSGDINVDDAVNWNTNTLTLTAADNVNINAVMTASSAAGLALNAATANGSDAAVAGGAVNAMPGSGRVDFTGSGNSLSINGHSYTLLSSASALQGIGDAGYYAVATNIDAGGISNFSPIGQDIFNGTLEGLGHTISNLNIDSTAGVAGLFAFMDGEVANLGLVDGHVVVGASTSGVGELAGVNEGVIRNVYATGTVTASGNDASVGGLVGDNEGSILNAYAAVAVRGSGAGSMVGGLVGIDDGFHSDNSAPIVNAYATGAVTGGSTGSAGGLVGFIQSGQIQNTYATGAVSGASGRGGLVGGGSGTIVDSYWDTQTTGQSTSAGGVGETTAQLQANLPSGFSTSTWALVPGKSYPYLLRQFMPGVTPVAVSGTVFTDAGTTVAGAGVAVNAQSGGNALDTTATYANGYFYYLFDPSTLVGGNLLVYAKNYGSGGATNGAAFADGYGTLPALGIFGNAFHVQTGATQWSTVLADLAGAEGGGATAATALAHLPASGLANLVLGGQGAFDFDSALDWTAGNLDVTTGGNLTQSAAYVTVAGTASFDAGAGDITLGNADNYFSGTVIATGNNITLSDSNALAAVLAANGSGVLAAGGTLAVNGWTSGNLTTYAASATNFGATTVGGSLSATAGGAITQTDALNVAGTTALDAGWNAITLDNSGNDFTGGVSATGSGVSLHNANDLTIVSLTDNGGAVNLVAGGTLSLPAGDIDTGSDDLMLVSNGGSLVTPGALGGGNVSLSGRDGLSLNDDVTASGTLQLASSAGSISQAAGIITAGTLTGSSSGATTLTGANIIGTLGSFAAAGFSLNDTQALTVSGPVDGGGSTTLTTTAGDLTLDGNVSGTTTTLNSAGAIVLQGDLDASSLMLNAVGTISGASAINVDLFDLQSGDWVQNGATLPAFSATDFRLDAGSSFLRVLGGDGTAASSYQIADVYGLQGINGFLSSNFDLAGDIDASGTASWNSGAGFVPIGDGTTNFTGVFDGLNHAIGGLTIDRPDTGYAGLFGVITDGMIRNVGLLDASVTGQNYVGGLAGYNYGSISNAYATGTVTGVDEVGGLVGASLYSISNAYATGAVSGRSEVGGLVGYNLGGISNAYATGAVTGVGEVGGLVGSYYSGNISSAYWATDSSGQTDSAGGTGMTLAELESALPAGFDASVWADADGHSTPYLLSSSHAVAYIDSDAGTTNLYDIIRNVDELQAMQNDLSGHYALGNDIDASATVNWNVGDHDADATTPDEAMGFTPIGNSSTNVFTGVFDGLSHAISGLTIDRPTMNYVGLFGYNTGTIRDLGLEGGSVTGVSEVGGLVGNNNYGSISEAYANGSVTGTAYVGGLVGFNYGSISNAYATGSVSGTGGSDVGGLVGHNAGGGISASFYATTDADDQAINNSGSTGSVWTGNTNGTAKTWAELTTLSTFAAWGNDIDDAGGTGTVWRIYEGETTPLLRSFLTGVTVTADSGGSKTYDGTTDAGDVGYTPSSIGAALDGTASYTLDSKNAGTRTVSVDGLYSDQQGYDISYADGSYAVGQATLTLSAVTDSKTYDGTTTSTGTVGVSGLQIGDHLISAATQSFASKNVLGTDASTLQVDAGYGIDDGNGGANYTVVTNAATGTITPKAISGDITAIDKTYDGTTSATTSGTLIGVVPDDDVAFDIHGAFEDKNAGSGKTVDVSGSLSGTDANNYTLGTNATTTADIAQAAFTVSTNNVSKTYDGTTSAVGTLVVTGGQLYASDTISGGTFAFTDADAGTGKTVTVSGATVGDGNSGGNYDVSYVDNTAGTITPKALTASLTGTIGKTYDGTTAATLAAADYALDGFVGGQGATVTQASGTYNSANVADAATVTATLGSGDFAADSGTNLSNYALPTSASGAGSIAQATLVVTANDAGKTYDGLAYNGGNGVTYSGFVNGETASVLGGTLAYGGTAQGATNAGSYALTPGGLISSNYAITEVGGSLTIDKARATVIANSGEVTYNGQSQSVTGYTASGLVNGETTSVLTGLSDVDGVGTNAGSYTHAISGSDGNYDLSFVAGSLTIDKAQLTVTANDAGKAWDGVAYSGGNGVAYNGFVGGESASVLGGTLAYGGSAQGAVDTGDYAISASGYTSDNYAIGYVDGTLTIAPALTPPGWLDVVDSLQSSPAALPVPGDSPQVLEIIDGGVNLGMVERAPAPALARTPK